MTTNEDLSRIFGAEGAAEILGTEQPKAVEKAETPAIETPEVTETTQVEEPADPELESAWKALERDGWSKADLKKLSVDTIKERGAKRAKNHEDVDRAYADLKSWKAKAEKPAAVHDSAAAKSDDLSVTLKTLEETFGPDVAKAMQPMVEKLRALEQQTQSVQQAEAAREKSRIQSEITGVYPEISKDAVWNAVAPQALALIEQNPETSAVDAVRAVLRDFYGERTAQPAAKKASNLKNTPESPTRTQTPKPASKEEREFAALLALERGATREEAQKVYQG